MKGEHLYFIALIPHQKLRETIKILKDEMKTRFNIKHALKSPAHITLQPPFKKDVTKESDTIQWLEKFALKQEPFNIELSGFGCFSQRVIFVNVISPKLIVNLHSHLNNELVKKLNFDKNEIKQNIHPHITIATRDLNKERFQQAWPEFEMRTFKARFQVKSIFLLKHNGKQWDIFHEFCFNKFLK